MRVSVLIVSVMFGLVAMEGTGAAQVLVGDGVVAPACVPWVEESTIDPIDVDYSGSQQWVEQDTDVAVTVTLFCALHLTNGIGYDRMGFWAYDNTSTADNWVHAVIYKFDRSGGSTTVADTTAGRCDAYSTNSASKTETTDDCYFTADTDQYFYYAIVQVRRSSTANNIEFYAVGVYEVYSFAGESTGGADEVTDDSEPFGDIHGTMETGE